MFLTHGLTPVAKESAARRGGLKARGFFSKKNAEVRWESGGAFYEGPGNTAGREGAERDSHRIGLRCSAKPPQGGDTPEATGVSP